MLRESRCYRDARVCRAYSVLCVPPAPRPHSTYLNFLLDNCITRITCTSISLPSLSARLPVEILILRVHVQLLSHIALWPPFKRLQRRRNGVQRKKSVGSCGDSKLVSNQRGAGERWVEGGGREKKGEEESRGGRQAQTAASGLFRATEEIGRVFKE